MNLPNKKEMVGNRIELAFQSGWNACHKAFMDEIFKIDTKKVDELAKQILEAQEHFRSGRCFIK